MWAILETWGLAPNSSLLWEWGFDRNPGKRSVHRSLASLPSRSDPITERQRMIGGYNHLRNERYLGSMKPFSEGEPGSLGYSHWYESLKYHQDSPIITSWWFQPI